MSGISGAEQAGLVLGRDFDIVAKEPIPVLRRFRREAIIISENVGRAGDFLARALVATIEKRVPDARQGLEPPGKIDWGQPPRQGG